MTDGQPARIGRLGMGAALLVALGTAAHGAQPASEAAAVAASAAAPAGPVQAGANAWSQGRWAGAVALWQGPAARGDADAQFDLGQAYKLGRGVPQDLVKAEALFAKAAAQGHVQAADNYGLLRFQRGDHTGAMPYIHAAADRGDPRAQYVLGIVLFNGEGEKADWVRAYALESLSEQAGWPPAKKALAQMDGYIPLDQRQQAVQMATDLAAQAEVNRHRQTAANDMQVAAAEPAEPVVEAPAMAAPPPSAPLPRPVAPRHVTAPALASVDAPRPRAVAAPDPVPVTGGGWKLQLGAFGVAANADALWARVHGLPAVAGHPRQMAPLGRVQRLLATGYSAEGAAAACRALTGAGFACIATRD